MSQLTIQFGHALAIFNTPGANYNGLSPYYHPNLTMKRVDDPTSITGAANVITYLNGTQLIQLPQFDLGAVWNEWPPTSDGAVYAVISGPRGTYQDNSIAYVDVNHVPHAPSTPYPVNYIFNFTRKTTADRWLLISAIAVPT